MSRSFNIRKKTIGFENLIRRLLLILDYLIWLVFDYKKLSIRPRNPKRILVIDFGGFGDCLNTFCLASKLKSLHPDKDIYFLTTSSFRKAVGNESKIKLLEYNSGQDFISGLRKLKFDISIEINLGPVKSRDIRFIPFKIGSEVEGINSVFLMKKYFLSRKIFPFYSHKIKERFRIFELAGFKFDNYKLNLPISPSYAKEAESLAKRLKFKKSEKVLFLNPSSGTSSKARAESKIPSHDWPLENFAKLADSFLENKNSRVLILGGKEDSFIAESIIKLMNTKSRVNSIAGLTSFFGLAELMRKFQDSGCLVSLDTGTVHLATSVNIPVIDLMGPYDPKLYCAWNPSQNLEQSRAISIFHHGVCSKCRKYACSENQAVCMKSISVEEVNSLVDNFI